MSPSDVVIVTGAHAPMTDYTGVLKDTSALELVARSGFRLGEGKLEDSLMAALLDGYGGCSVADTAENVALEYGVTRRACDEYALRRRSLRYGLATACIGGGQGIAMIVESLS